MWPLDQITKTTTPDSKDSGRYVKNNLEVRQEFQFYLDAAYRASLTENEPFVYTVGTAYNDEIYDDHEFGVMIGKKYSKSNGFPLR